ncbi:MAG: acyltransferase family protein [Desulfobacterales bacterium]|nr:acyltransferase family protein [Desulfobacterales bacterium]
MVRLVSAHPEMGANVQHRFITSKLFYRKELFMANTFQLTVSRFRFVDIAKIYGVALMYYGHIIESYVKAGSAVAAMHYKFIYSFHMPLFFILSGYIAKEHVSNTEFGLYLKRHVASRLVPYAFLSMILIIPTFWTTGFTVGLELPTVEGYVKGISATFLAGLPYFNIPTWFLICLFVVEMMHYATSRFLTSNSRVILMAIVFYLIGSLLAWNAVFLNPINILSPHGKIFPYFMIIEAFTCYSLYLVGVYFRRNNFLVDKIPAYRCILGALACLVLVYYTFDLNKGMFTIPFYDAVVLFASSHGNLILFPFTAIIGSVMIMLLAKLSTGIGVLMFLGGNTLIIFGLNGVFYHFINDKLALWLFALHSDDAMMILASGIVIALTSISLTIPFVFLLNYLIPQLIGKPKLDGPLISRLVS